MPSTTLPVPLKVIEPPTLTVAKNERVASTRRARHEQRQRQVLPRVDRQRLDLLLRDDPRDLRLRRVDDRRLAADRDGLGQRLHLAA